MKKMIATARLTVRDIFEVKRVSNEFQKTLDIIEKIVYTLIIKQNIGAKNDQKL